MSLVSIGLIPEIEAVECGTGETWQEAERRWIATYRAKGARLVNATDGGEGTPGLAITPDGRRERSERIRKRLAAMTAEQRSEMVRRAKAACTPEQRSESARKAVAAYLASTTHEERSAPRKKGAAKRPNPLVVATAEQRHEWARNAKAAHLAKTTPEQRSAEGRRSAATRAARRRA